MAFVQVLSEGWGWGAQMEAAELREDGRLRDEGRVSKRGTKDWELVCSMTAGDEDGGGWKDRCGSVTAGYIVDGWDEPAPGDRL